MFCHRCGNQLPNDAVFCNGCGTRTLSSDQATPAPSPLGKVTIEFGDSSPSPQITRQFGDSSPMTPPQFSSNPQYPQYPPAQFGDNSGAMPSQFRNSQYTPAWHVSTSPLSQQGVSPALPVQQAATPNAIQQFLIRVFGANLASNALFGVVLGGIFAVIVGVLATALLLSITHAIAPHLTSIVGYSNSEDIMDYSLAIFPLHNLFRDSLQLFLVAQGVGTHAQYGYGSIAYFSPLHGLLILPALLLTLAGYLAASSDFQNRVQTSLWRGAAVALPYTILLFLLATQANGCIPGSGPDSSAGICQLTPSSSAGLLSMDTLTIFVFGLLWGALFGLLGASLKLARGRWRHMLRQYLRLSSRPQVMGMIVGGLAASGLGIALALLVLFSFIAYSSYSLPLLVQRVCLPAGDWQPLTAWSIAQGPLHAVNLFFLSFGTPINISNPQQSQCFYIAAKQASFTLFGSTPQLSPWTHLLLALPIISLFLGGRVSAAIGRVQGIGPGAIQGALIALPFSVLMALLAVISTITNTFTSNGSTASGSFTSFVQSAGAGVFELFLWALLSGAVVGALGGMYQSSTVKVTISHSLTALSRPLAILSMPGYFILDRISGQPRTLRRSPARSLLYATLLCTLLLVIAAGVGGGMLIALNQSIAFTTNVRVRDILSVLLIALPGLLLLCACASALSRDPLIEDQSSAPAFAWQQ